jgi:hypothetical protein
LLSKEGKGQLVVIQPVDVELTPVCFIMLHTAQPVIDSVVEKMAEEDDVFIHCDVGDRAT